MRISCGVLSFVFGFPDLPKPALGFPANRGELRVGEEAAIGLVLVALSGDDGADIAEGPSAWRDAFRGRE